MAFSTYKSLRAVIKDFQIAYTEQNWLTPTAAPLSDYFREDLEGFIQDGVPNNSEYAICENYIAPLLKEAWKPYRQILLLWSHETFHYNDTLNGVPDYIVARRSPLGKIILDQPCLLIVEAKQDNFDEGWGQCLAAMLAAQGLNENKEQVLYGIVSNGEIWEFAQLQRSQFIKNKRVYLFQDLDQLYGALDTVFQACTRQLQLKLG